MVIGRPTLGPQGINLLEHVLDVLADHPAEPDHKLEAFALLGGLTALFVQNEMATAGTGDTRHSAYLRHIAAAGQHPRITALLAGSVPDHTTRDRFDDVLNRPLAGVLG